MKIPKRILMLTMVSTCLYYSSKAQDQSIIELQVKDKDSIPTFIVFKETGKRFSQGQEKDVFKKYLKLTNDDELKKGNAEKDELGFTHEKYTQLYKGIKVEFAEYAVHSKNGTIESINGHFKRVGKIDISPKISKESALQKALDYTGAKVYMWEIPEMEQWIKKEKKDANATLYPQGEIVIVQDRLGDGEMRLAYKFEVYASEPISRNYIYVDANTGKIINIEAILLDFAETNNADTRYSGPRHIDTDFLNGMYWLFDSSRGAKIEVWNMKSLGTLNAVPFKDSNNVWTAAEWDNPQKDNAALDALWAAQMTYDYFKVKHNRNSYDKLGGLIRLYVHWDINYDRSAWAGGGDVYMGDGGVKYKPLTAIDVVAHEIGHAICFKTANLSGKLESKALREGFSDIWGACVKNFAAPEKNIWLSGDEINKTSFCTRSMSNPNIKNHPDTYLSKYWYSGTDEDTYTHTNCGVLNHWFYLLSVGGEDTNSRGDYYMVSGIGIENAAKIAYRMEDARYLDGMSEFVDARFAALKAARDFFGVNSAQVIQTAKAWYAVGVGEENVIPVITDYQIRGGRDNATYNSTDAFYVTPASGATSYRWSVIPYSMSCSADKLPYFVGSNSGASVLVKHGTCSGQYILRCEAVTYYSSISYQDRAINVYNPSGGGGSGDPDPCAALMSIYPNPSKKSEFTTLQLQYPDPCDGEVYPLAADAEQELSVYDLSGNLVLQENFSSDTYSFRNADFKKDIYILVLKDKRGKLHQKRFAIN